MVTSIGQQQFINTELFSRSSAAEQRLDVAGANQNPPETQDVLDLSRQVFDIIEQGIQNLRQASLDLTTQRLEAAQELLQTTVTLLNEAADEQKESIVRNVGDIATSLRSIADQIEHIFGGANSQAAVIYRESLNVDIEFTVEQSRIIAAQLEAQRTQTLSIAASGLAPQLLEAGTQFQDILSSFRQTIQEFRSLINSLFSAFTPEELQPEVPVDLLAAFLNGTLEIPTA